MIDEDFQPTRIQLKALGILLLQAQVDPVNPVVTEPELYEQLKGQGFGGQREHWLKELLQFGLVHSETDFSRPGYEFDEHFQMLCLTPAGVFYTVARAQVFAENWRGLLEDLPNEVVDAPWPLQAYYSPDPDAVVPASDGFVRFDHNAQAYQDALAAIDGVAEAVRSDNTFGAREPEARDRKLEELQAIRNLLEAKEGWQTRLLAVGWTALGYLISKFSDGPIGYAAEHAWTALQAVLGLE